MAAETGALRTAGAPRGPGERPGKPACPGEKRPELKLLSLRTRAPQAAPSHHDTNLAQARSAAGVGAARALGGQPGELRHLACD